jgi:hypothetical protein
LGGMTSGGGTGRWPGTPCVLLAEAGMGRGRGRVTTGVLPGEVLLQGTWRHLWVQQAVQRQCVALSVGSELAVTQPESHCLYACMPSLHLAGVPTI